MEITIIKFILIIGADQALYFWLLNLEEVYTENNNSLPKTVYYQIDGGSENANKATYGTTYLLIML
jgi:hypothetical protein